MRDFYIVKHPYICRIVFVLVLLYATPCKAEFVNINGVKYSLSFHKASVEGYSKVSDTLIIPQTISYKNEEYKVTTINGSSFRNCENLSVVNLPDSIDFIGERAFEGCCNLRTIILPKTIKSLPNYIFAGCSNLEEVAIPHTVTSIGYGAFDSCKNLKEITIPQSVTTIGSGAFVSCKNITSVNIPNSIKNIPDCAFQSCDNLSTINLPDSIESFGETVFFCCKSLKRIVLPKNLSSIPSCTFLGCENLQEITIPTSVSSIGNLSFGKCHKLKSLVIPNSVTSIGVECFNECSSLSELTIPSSVTSIGEKCLAGCSSLEKLTIPFVGGAPNPTAPAENTLFGWIFGNQQATDCEETKQSYPISPTAGRVLGFYIPKRLSKVVVTGGSNLYCSFNNCTNIEEIVLQGDVRIIGERTFSGCTNLKEIKLPNSIETIGDGAFYNCEKLLNIAIPQNVSSIAKGAFDRCYNLQTVEFHALDFQGNNIRSLFQPNYNDYKLSTIIVGDNVTKIPYNVFQSLKNIKCMSIGNGCVEIGSSALYLADIDTLHLPKNISAISSQGTNSIRYVTYAGMKEDWANVQNESDIYPNVFHYGFIIPGEEFEENGIYYCANDTLPATVSIIAGEMPYSKNIFIPREVTKEGRTFRMTNISDNAFKDCNQLDTIFYEGNKIEWKKLLIGKNNEILKEIPIVYNYKPNEETQKPVESNIIYIEELRLRKGKQLRIPVKLKNTSSITGFQFELSLHNGFSIAKNELSDELKIEISSGRGTNNAHDIFKASQLNNGRYLVICSSTSNAVFSDNDGEIMSLYVDIDESVKDGNYAICLKNISVSDSEANVTRQKETSYPITLYSYIRGDVNNDSDINIGDISCIANIILGDIEETYCPEAADVNQDSDINVGDIACTGEYILNGAFSTYADIAHSPACLSAFTQPNLSMPGFVLEAGSEHNASVVLDHDGEVTALQFDLQLPDGIHISQEFGKDNILQNDIIANNHVLDWARQDNADIRVINYSVTNDTYPNSKFDVVSMKLKADSELPEGMYTIALKNIVLATRNKTIKLGDRYMMVRVCQATGISSTKTDDHRMSIYDLQGRKKVRLERGINIFNGKKIIK